MSSKSLDRWLLVNYAGYPYAPNSLMPDNGLANLAGALLQDGRQVDIQDFCTVQTLRMFSSPELATELTRAWNTIRSPRTGIFGKATKLAALAALHRAERVRRRKQEEAVARIADRVLERIRRNRIQAVGFKLWSGDGLDGAAAIAEHIRRHVPDVKIFGGGPQVDVFMEHLLGRHSCFDAMVYGDGEQTVRRLADDGADAACFAAIPNLLFARDGSIRKTEDRIVADLDELPMPAYDPAIYPSMEGHEKIRIIVVDESRGCRNSCAFCSHPVKSSRRLRTKSIPRLIREVESFGRRFGTSTFRFAGSCTPYSLLNAFAAEVLQRRMSLRYTSFAHVRDSDEADFSRMKESGCAALFFGIESGSQTILDRLGKGVKASMIPATLRKAKDAGIFTVGSLIYPAPGETDETTAETLGLLAEERPNALTVAAPIVTPRTAWFENPEKYGIVYKSRRHYIEAGLRWKLSLILPPAFWGELPVRIDGRTYKQVLRKTTEFVRRIEQAGYHTSLSDDLYLMSERAGMDPVQFRDETRAAFFAGDIPRITGFVERMNASV